MLELIDGEHELAPGVTAVPAYGHTPGHMCLRIESQGQLGMICGDAILHPAQINEPTGRSSFDVGS